MSGQDPNDRVLRVPGSLDGERLDRALAILADLSRSAAAAMLARRQVRVDGQVVVRGAQGVRAGSRLEMGEIPKAPRLEADPCVEFAVAFEDPHLIVVDKPWALVVHPGAGRLEGTLVSGLLAGFPELAELDGAEGTDPGRPGIVHRLDRGTSGLLVVARSVAALRSLRAQMAAHTPERLYLALVHGELVGEGLIDAPLARATRRPDRMAVSARGRPARTRYEVLSRHREPLDSTLLVLRLETGRTHQIRAHLEAIGHPVVGDPRYGAKRAEAGLEPGRFFLHGFSLVFEHPADGKRVSFGSALPADLVKVIGPLPQLQDLLVARQSEDRSGDRG
ncbi:MAG: RluA family pseudouridine synthase [Acidimicrobiales bacterium]